MRTSSNREGDRIFIDKDPIYKTHSIYCNVFDRKVTLRPGPRSETNCRGFIFLDFTQRSDSLVECEEKKVAGYRYYSLDCGHTQKTSNVLAKGDITNCLVCSGQMVYWSHTHEWSHIIFRSNPFLYKAFTDKYQHKLVQEGYDITPGRLSEFIHLFINAFDDLRCNSLVAEVYPGAAYEIDLKWKRICEESSDINKNFIQFIFGVALRTNNINPKGQFAELIPIIEEATNKIRLKGPANMLTIVRWALDRCVKKLLQTQPPQQGGQGGQQKADETGNEKHQDNKDSGSQGAPSTTGDDQNTTGDGSPDQDQQGNSGSPGDDQAQGRQDSSSGSGSKLGPNNSSSNDGGDRQLTSGAALQMMAKGATALTPTEGHHKGNLSEKDPASQATTAALQKALNADVEDDVTLNAGINTNVPDADVQAALNKLKSISKQPQATNFILSQAKANILLVDVKAADISSNSVIDINSSDKQSIDRMRAAFARAMGREKYKMAATGSDIDVSSVIQFLLDPSDDEVFELETATKGFAYRILGDMSGSMTGNPFATVCRAHEMLKRSLDYPFVQGDFWGFRGAENTRARGSSDAAWKMSATNGGQIYLYRYHKDCAGYLGRSWGVNINNKREVVDVKCGGLTPMHSALHVAIKDLVTQTPAGMVKRMFLLTDGNPTQFTTKGKNLSKSFLRQLVTKEIRTARQKGVAVYIFIIGTSITDKHALEMFGPRRFWRRVGADNSIGQALVEVVLSEFVKYLKSN